MPNRLIVRHARRAYLQAKKPTRLEAKRSDDLSGSERQPKEQA